MYIKNYTDIYKQTQTFEYAVSALKLKLPGSFISFFPRNIHRVIILQWPQTLETHWKNLNFQLKYPLSHFVWWNWKICRLRKWGKVNGILWKHNSFSSHSFDLCTENQLNNDRIKGILSFFVHFKESCISHYPIFQSLNKTNALF